MLSEPGSCLTQLFYHGVLWGILQEYIISEELSPMVFVSVFFCWFFILDIHLQLLPQFSR